ncbi:hypothetical protein TNCV_2198611 [Trichonephila clavipes]|nr:hypothetical protein TNCV_2198611 [Trichonephila clavipes]
MECVNVLIICSPLLRNAFKTTDGATRDHEGLGNEILNTKILRMSGKKLSLQEALELLQSQPSESDDSLIDDSSDEEVPANNFLEFSLDSEEDDEEIE